MSKLNRVFNVITVNILIMFSIGFIGTYLSDYFIEQNLFGDSGAAHWGARHYWYNWGVFFLFLSNFIRAIFKVINVVNEEFSNL